MVAATVFALALARVSVAQGGPPAQPVVAAPAVEMELPASMRLVGTVLPDRAAIVASEVSGLIAAYDAQEGQFLRAGDVICRLDATLFELRRDEAAAKLESLRAKLAELEKGTREEELKRWQATLDEAQAIYEKWDFERKRIAELRERSQSSLKEWHDTEMEYLAAARRVAQYTAMLEEAQHGPRPETIAQARFDASAQEAIVRRHERDLAKASIRAPFDGFVVAKRTEIGEWIQEGGAVADMVAVETVKLRADVPESAVHFCKPGAPATVVIDALNRTIPAQVTRVIPRAAASARTFPVEIDIPNSDHTLLPGMFVWAHVPGGPTARRLMIPKDAVVLRGPAKQIFAIRPGENGTPATAMPMSVTTGLEVEGLIEVDAPGLKAGDLVVTRNNERLFGPTPVIVTPPTSQPAAARP